MESMLTVIVNGTGWVLAGWFFKRELDQLRKDIQETNGDFASMGGDLHKLETSLRVLQTEAVKRNGYDKKLSELRKSQREIIDKHSDRLVKVEKGLSSLKSMMRAFK